MTSRAPYRAPQLTVLGSVEQMTQALVDITTLLPVTVTAQACLDVGILTLDLDNACAVFAS